MDVWFLMSLMWIRLCPRASFPMKPSPSLHPLPALVSSSSAHDRLFTGLESSRRSDRLQMELVCRAIPWRQTDRLLNRTASYRWVCLSVAAVWISAVIAPAAGQTQAEDRIVPPFCRISHVLRQRRKRRRCCDRWAVRFLTAHHASLKCRSLFVDVERKNVPRGCFILPL